MLGSSQTDRPSVVVFAQMVQQDTHLTGFQEEIRSCTCAKALAYMELCDHRQSQCCVSQLTGTDWLLLSGSTLLSVFGFLTLYKVTLRVQGGGA